jgi:hypothetical protein
MFFLGGRFCVNPCQRLEREQGLCFLLWAAKTDAPKAKLFDYSLFVAIK